MLLLTYIIPYICVAGVFGAVHQIKYSPPPYNMSPWVSYLIVGLFWPIMIPVVLIVFILRAVDVDI